MARNYARVQAVDTGGNPHFQCPPPFKAYATYAPDTSGVSSVITLNDNTSVVEVAAQGTAAVIRWIPTTETAAVSPFASVISSTIAANFDNVVPANSMRRFVVPREVMGTSSLVGINITEGLYRRLAIKNTGIGSVLTIEV